jgi:hypothetical protein
LTVGIRLRPPSTADIIAIDPTEYDPMANTLSDAALTELERLDVASPAPWRLDYTEDDVESFAIEHAGGLVLLVQETEAGEWDDEVRKRIEADLTLAVAARNSLTALVAKVRRLRGDQLIIIDRTP